MAFRMLKNNQEEEIYWCRSILNFPKRFHLLRNLFCVIHYREWFKLVQNYIWPFILSNENNFFIYKHDILLYL